MRYEYLSETDMNATVEFKLRNLEQQHWAAVLDGDLKSQASLEAAILRLRRSKDGLALNIPQLAVGSKPSPPVGRGKPS